MKSKADQTKDYILRLAAPIFNKKGYTATSLADVIIATKLTKGAIYGNFLSKEDLAIKSFRFNVNIVLASISKELNKTENAVEKLFLLTNFYRNYYEFVDEMGGCPILNVATDTNNVNTNFFEVVKEITSKTERNLKQLIQSGIDKEEINKAVNSNLMAKNIYSMIEGSIFMSFMHRNKIYISEMMNQIDALVKRECL